MVTAVICGVYRMILSGGREFVAGWQVWEGPGSVVADKKNKINERKSTLIVSR